MCDMCRDSWAPWVNKKYVELASDFERRAELCMCPGCGELCEIFPDDLTPPSAITQEEAIQRFPGAL